MLFPGTRWTTCTLTLFIQLEDVVGAAKSKQHEY